MRISKFALVTQWVVVFFVTFETLNNIAVAETTSNCRSSALRKTSNEIARLRRAALGGNADAAWSLFLHYDLGVSDWKEREVWLKRAAQLGNQKAKQTINELKHVGLNRSSNRNADLELPSTEVSILRSNALKGDGYAAWTLFLHYNLGLNDEKEGEIWLRLAAKMGNRNALGYLGDQKSIRK